VRRIVIDGFPEGKTGDRHTFAGEMVICQRGTEIAIRSLPVLKLCSQGSVTRKDPPANKKKIFPGASLPDLLGWISWKKPRGSG